jgi:alpha-glucosidase
MVSALHSRNIKFLAYVNPFVVTGLDHFATMDAAGLLIKDASGKTYLHPSPAGDASHPDLTNPAARDYVKGFLSKMVKDVGIDGWMADFGEWVPIDSVPGDGSDPISSHNRYPVEWHRLSREVMESERPSGDWAVFSRSGWNGDPGASQITWVGDQEATWSATDGLPTVVPALLNLGLSAAPFATLDIGGFSGGPRTKELFMRWTELGAFTPIMRTHEGNLKSENWQWDGDAETTLHFARFARIHAVLGPELETLAGEAVQSSMPMIRHLMLEFPDDPPSRDVSDEFLLGPSLLVAPITSEGATEREVYLPPGSWFHVWTGKQYAGAQSVLVSAPIGSPPVFSRDIDRPDLRAIQ